MRPKEIQEKLGIDAERIKLFKREGIFKPEHPPVGNKATDYTEADFKNLQRIVVLTKSGLTCGDIKKLQAGEIDLEQAIRERKQYINDELERKRNALKMLDNLLDDSAEFDTFQTQHYWDIISEKEAAGEEFIDIEDMYGYRPVSLKESANVLIAVMKKMLTLRTSCMMKALTKKKMVWDRILCTALILKIAMNVQNVAIH